MKNVILFLALFLSSLSFGQTPFGVQNSANAKGVGINQVSLANLWVGSKLSYNLNDENPLDENFLFTAKAIYTPIFGEKYAIPIAITVSPTGGSVLAPESGVNFGIYPYYKLISSPTTTFLVHGGLAFKSLENDGQEVLQQFKALAGLELAITGASGGAPFTLSVSPVYTNTSGTLGSKTFLEATAVLPIAKNIGALIDWQSGDKSIFKIGVIVNAAIK